MSAENVPQRAEQTAVEAAPPAAALVLKGKPDTLKTDEEARSEAVGNVLAGAYSKASELKLTLEESKALRSPFPDECVRGGALGDANILFISHIHLSDRLNDVLGIGQWALIKRSQRAEQAKSNKGEDFVRIYYEGVLLIRGAFVAEAIGVGIFHKNNPKEDYGTGLESAMSDCVNRCCKRLGIGSQTWDKNYCERWLRTRRGGGRRAEDVPEQSAPPAGVATERDRLMAEAKALGLAPDPQSSVRGLRALIDAQRKKTPPEPAKRKTDGDIATAAREKVDQDERTALVDEVANVEAQATRGVIGRAREVVGMAATVALSDVPSETLNRYLEALRTEA